MIMKIFEWIVGYCVIEIKSKYCEQVLTAASRSGAAISQIRRIDENTVRIHTGLFDDKDIEDIVKTDKDKFSPNTEITVIQKNGLLPWLVQHKMRSGFAAGFILCIAATILMLSVIWAIDVTGLYEISAAEFSDALEQNGLYIGAFSNGHDFDAIRIALMREFENIAYVTFNINGSRLSVDVVESTMPPDTVDNTDYRNIVAKTDGVLITAEAYEGKIAVKAGQAVKKGELLVSGIFTSKVIGYRLVRASALMLAYTRRTYEAFIPYTITEYEKTDNSIDTYELSVFNIAFSLPFQDENAYEYFDTTDETIYLTAGEKVLPLSVKISHIQQLEPTVYILSYEEAKQRLLCELNEEMRIDLHGLDVKDEQISFTETELGLYCKIDCTVIDDIAQPQTIYTEFVKKGKLSANAE